MAAKELPVEEGEDGKETRQLAIGGVEMPSAGPGITVIRGLVKGTLCLAGWTSTASGRRAHTDPAPTLQGIP